RELHELLEARYVTPRCGRARVDGAVGTAPRADLDHGPRGLGGERKMAAEHLQSERTELELAIEDLLDLVLARGLVGDGVGRDHGVQDADREAAPGGRKGVAQL